jgi:hypothetical protein
MLCVPRHSSFPAPLLSIFSHPRLRMPHGTRNSVLQVAVRGKHVEREIYANPTVGSGDFARPRRPVGCVPRIAHSNQISIS